MANATLRPARGQPQAQEAGRSAPAPGCTTRKERSPVPWFGALSLYLIAVHEPWRDEAQAWLIVRDAPGWSGLVHVMGYEGTPALWHAMLWPLAKLGLPFMAARVLHAALATACVALLWRAPFPAWARWLLPAGYFLAYEFNAIARSYVLVVLLLLLLARFDGQRRERPVLYGVLLALLANASAHGLLLAGVWGAFLAVELTLSRAWSKPALGGAALGVAGLVVAALQLRPPDDVQPSLVAWDFTWGDDRTTRLADILGTTFMPLPQAESPFWNHFTFLTDAWGRNPVLLVGLACLGTGLVALRRDRRALALAATATAILLGFFLFKDFRGARHAGLLWAVLVATWWIAWPQPQGRRRGGQARTGARGGRFGVAACTVATAVLAVHAFGAVHAIQLDTQNSFSEGSHVADFLEDAGYTNGTTLLVGLHGYTLAPILAELDPDVRFFFTEYRAFGSYAVWNTSLDVAGSITIDDVLERMPAYGPGTPYERALLVLPLTDGLGGSEAAIARLQPVGKFVPELIGTWRERYQVFEIRPVQPAA
jgi:hypothetical protein